MLVKELKKEIKDYNKKELENIIVELYKRLPKSRKEDYDIDKFIQNIKLNGKTTKRETSFEDLHKEIIYFLTCVDNEYYAIPNKVISKKERSSWRFKVKKYYKELNNISPKEENGALATCLLIEIFKRLSIGSNRLLFINWETFRALGVTQSEYYDTLIQRIFYDGYSKENLQKCIDLLDIEKDPYELSYDMFEMFICNLKTVDIKELAIPILDNKMQQLAMKQKNVTNSNIRFYLEQDINHYVECIVEIYFSLSEVDKGIKYFHKNYIESDKEIKEYILLNKLDDLNFIKDWLNEYEKNINKINYRDSLRKRYDELK